MGPTLSWNAEKQLLFEKQIFIDYSLDSSLSALSKQTHCMVYPTWFGYIIYNQAKSKYNQI
jgi:hypothetical protein